MEDQNKKLEASYSSNSDNAVGKEILSFFYITLSLYPSQGKMGVGCKKNSYTFSKVT